MIDNLFFLSDTSASRYLRNLRYTGNTTDVIVTLSLTSESLKITLNEETFHATPTTSGLFIIDTPQLFLVAESPKYGEEITAHGLKINPCRVELLSDADTPAAIEMHIQHPIYATISPKKIIVGLRENYRDSEPTETHNGLRSINGLIPDSNGNIVIRSIDPGISVIVN